MLHRTKYGVPLITTITSTPEGPMKEEDIVERIQKNPKFMQFVSMRNRYSIIMTVLMMVVYFGYILLIAFNKPFLSQRLGDGVMTVGIPLGFGVIVFTVIITAYYVRRANSEFDDLTETIRKAVLQ